MQPLLTIDLSTGEKEILEVPASWERQYLGGASLAARLLYDYLSPDIDPLAPESPLLFLTGPLSGTSGPAVGRFTICARSPATGLWGESNCGGFWGVQLRKTGYDGLLIRGKAISPVYLSLTDDQIEIKEARHLWGLETYQTQTAIQAELGSNAVSVATIGPSGENLVPYSLILCDHGCVAGRTGMGAIMGSKNLKAIAVKGNKKIPIAYPDRYHFIRSEVNRELKDDPVSQVARELGTASVADYFDYLKEMPKKYFQRSTLDGELSISGTNVKNTILSGVSTCHACVIACGRIIKLSDEIKRKGPEYETLVGFGPNLLIDDLEKIALLGETCDRLGLDSISMSNVIGLAFKLFESGMISLDETDRLTLEWGNSETVKALIYKTARRDGFGDLLARGARSLAKYCGSEDEAVQVNGLEVAYHDPRGASGMALVYATSPRGACHNQSDYFLVEIGQCYPTLSLEYYSPTGGAEKATNVAKHQDWRTLFNSLVMCFFANVPPETVLELINAATNVEWSFEDMLKAGERAWNLKRVINHRLGLTRESDTLPKALLKPYLDDPQGSEGFTPNFTEMLAAYYNVRGWDPATGFPNPGKLIELDLKWTIDHIQELTAGIKKG